jgi:hypothetical protein
LDPRFEAEPFQEEEKIASGANDKETLPHGEL